MSEPVFEVQRAPLSPGVLCCSNSERNDVRASDSTVTKLSHALKERDELVAELREDLVETQKSLNEALEQRDRVVTDLREDLEQRDKANKFLREQLEQAEGEVKEETDKRDDVIRQLANRNQILAGKLANAELRLGRVYCELCDTRDAMQG